MTATIKYLSNNGAVEAEMNSFPTVSEDAAKLIAQKYMSQFPFLDAAEVYIEGAAYMTLIQKTSTWQKNN